MYIYVRSISKLFYKDDFVVEFDSQFLIPFADLEVKLYSKIDKLSFPLLLGLHWQQYLLI